jgi:F-type H+-transporting ATPase subunit delta
MTMPARRLGDRSRHDMGRVDVSEPVSISSGIAARYATALFELASEAKALDSLEADIETLGAALAESPEFVALISSPVVTRAEQGAAIDAIAAKAGLSEVVRSTLGLMASKRRLFVLPQLIAAVRARIAEEKGEVTAQVTAAKKLTQAQEDALSAALKKQFGKDVKINMAVDASLIGGLVVRVGSKMIDTSIKAKLANLQNSMKEVG